MSLVISIVYNGKILNITDFHPLWRRFLVFPSDITNFGYIRFFFYITTDPCHHIILHYIEGLLHAKKTVDVQKAVVFFRVQEDGIKNSIDGDRKDLNNITDLLNMLSKDDDGIGVEVLTRLGTYEASKNRSLKVALQTNSMVKLVRIKKCEKVKQSDQ